MSSHQAEIDGTFMLDLCNYMDFDNCSKDSVKPQQGIQNGGSPDDNHCKDAHTHPDGTWDMIGHYWREDWMQLG